MDDWTKAFVTDDELSPEVKQALWAIESEKQDSSRIVLCDPRETIEAYGVTCDDLDTLLKEALGSGYLEECIEGIRLTLP